MLCCASLCRASYHFSATAPTGQTLYYEIRGGSYVTVTFPGTTVDDPYPAGYARPTGNLEIPSSVTNCGTTYSVTHIDANAFEGCLGLTSVTIPNTVISIGSYAFAGCLAIDSVSMPSSLTVIPVHMFENCSSLTSVAIPESVMTIGYFAFRGCTSLTSVTIPSSVLNINQEAFADCINLMSVTVPRSVVAIGQDAFRLVRNVVYGGTATGTPWGALCQNGYVEDIFVYTNSAKTHLAGCAANVTAATIPNTVTHIGNRAFERCGSLATLSIPNTVVSIGSSAFEDCESLASVTLPNTMSIINDYLFSGCSSLASIAIPNSIDLIGEYAFSRCSSLGSVTIPNSVVGIDDNAFFFCTGLVSVTLGYSVGSVGNYAFQECRSLNHVTYNAINCSAFGGPSSPVFDGCTQLSSLTIGDSVQTLPGYAFQGTNVTSVTIPQSVTYIGDNAFGNCNNLESITYKAVNCTSMGSYSNPVFQGCPHLTSLTIAEGVQSIPKYAFRGCSSLASVAIPNTVTGIGESAFEGCRNLAHVTIPNSVTDLEEYAFRGCNGLTSVTIGNSVTNIEWDAFFGCSSLARVDYTGTVADWCRIGFGNEKANPLYYGRRLFIDGSEVTKLAVPNTTNRIGSYAFYNCSSLCDTATIPNTVETIGESAFRGCGNLTSFSFGSGLRSIGNYALRGCDHIDTMTAISEVPPTVGNNTFDSVDKSIPLTVPNGSVEAYRNATGWCEFTNIIGVDFPTENINVTDRDLPKVSPCNGGILVEGSIQGMVRIFDILGRLLQQVQIDRTPLLIDVRHGGVYLVQVGNNPVQRVAVAP